MLLYYVLDDRIMVAADLRQVTDVPFVGYAIFSLFSRNTCQETACPHCPPPRRQPDTPAV